MEMRNLPKQMRLRKWIYSLHRIKNRISKSKKSQSKMKKHQGRWKRKMIRLMTSKSLSIEKLNLKIIKKLILKNLMTKMMIHSMTLKSLFNQKKSRSSQKNRKRKIK